MLKVVKKKIEMLAFPVDTTAEDKANGKRCDPHACMYKVSITRGLHALFPNENHRVRIDAGHITFIHDSHHYQAKTPRLVASNLKKLDASLRCRDCKRLAGFCPRHNTSAHTWKCEAVKGHKVKVYRPHTRERQDQINAARRARVAAGKPDRIYRLRQRVVGFA
jgi:hypothetical protein